MASAVLKANGFRKTEAQRAVPPGAREYFDCNKYAVQTSLVKVRASLLLLRTQADATGDSNFADRTRYSVDRCQGHRRDASAQRTASQRHTVVPVGIGVDASGQTVGASGGFWSAPVPLATALPAAPAAALAAEVAAVTQPAMNLSDDLCCG